MADNVVLPLSSWGAILSDTTVCADDTQYICPVTNRVFNHFSEFADHIESGVVRYYQNDLDHDTLEFNPMELAADIIRLDRDD